MQIMWRFISERKGLFGLNLGLRFLKDLLPFAGPILVGIAVDLLSGTDRSLLGIDLATNDVSALYIIAGAMAILAVAKMIFGYIHTLVAAHMGRHVVEAARRDLSEASMQMALDERRRFNTGDLLDRCLADSKGLRSFTQNVIIRVISNTARAILPLIIMLRLDWVMALIVLAVIPMQSGLSGLLQRRLQKLTHVARTAEASHTSSVKEAIDGWNSVASVGGQDWVTSELQKTASVSEDAKIVKKRTTAAIGAIISLFTALGIAACYAVGGWRIISSGALDPSSVAAAGALTLGELTAFIGVARKTYAPFQAYTKIVSSYRTGLVNLERVAEVLDAPMIDPRRDGPSLVVTSGELRLDGVGFCYDSAAEPTLRDLTGRIPGRSLTVITGSSGAGKTTLLRMLMGLDKPTTGVISIDGQDINVARLASVQSAIALVPQEPMLFTGTLGENLTLGLENASTQDMLDACHKAGLLDLVRELPEGLDTEVGSGRHMLSGGQLRRMAIARALLRKPAILFLDEPTTGLDDLNSKQVLDTLRRIAQGATVLMVSHRRDPLAASDHHLVLTEGTWVEGDGNGDRWRPEEIESLTDNDAESPTGASAPATGSAPLAASLNGTNGTGQNGQNGQNGNGQQRHGIGASVEHRVLQLSTMGRPIAMQVVGSATSASPDPTRVMVVGGHRSSATVEPSVVRRVVASAVYDAQSDLMMAAVANVNPDAEHTSDGRTVLGIDLSSDHQNPVAGETLALHTTIHSWRPAALIDVGERLSNQRAEADIEVAIRYVCDADQNAPGWLAHVGSDVRRRLKTSRFSANVSLVPATNGSLTDIAGVPLIEVTALSPPHTSGTGRMNDALVEVTDAVYRAIGLSYQPDLVAI